MKIYSITIFISYWVESTAYQLRHLLTLLHSKKFIYSAHHKNVSKRGGGGLWFKKKYTIILQCAERMGTGTSPTLKPMVYQNPWVSHKNDVAFA